MYKYIAVVCACICMACTPKTTEKIIDNTNDEMVSFRSKAPASGEAKPVQMGEYTIEELENGLKLIIVENHKVPLVNFQLSLDSPPILEVDGGVDKTGYVDLAGALISSGTSKRTKAEIDKSVDNLGASLSTSGRSAFGQCLTKYVDEYMDVFSDVIKNPIFPEDEFNKGVKRTLSGIQSSQDDPNAIAGIVRNALVFGKDHPYGRSANMESVNNVTLDDVKRYYRETFYPSNAYLIIVGDITPDMAKKKAMQYFGDWKDPEAIPGYAPMPKPSKIEGAKVDFVNKPGAVQSVINIAYPIDIKPGDDDAIKASIMNAILGGGVFSSRLMQNLREDKAYTYGARSTLDIDPYQGYFNAYASVRNEVTDSSVVEFLKEMNTITMEKVNSENLDISKKFMTGTIARSISNPSTVARFALNTAKYNLPEDYYQNYISNISKVTQEDILDMAKKYIRPENAHIIVVGNKGEVAEELVRFDSDQTIDFYDVQGNFIEPAEETLPEGHTAEIVVSDFLDAVGGMDKINAVKDVVTTYKAEVMGRNATFKTMVKSNELLYSEVKVGKMTMQKQSFDGKVVKNGGMAGKSEATEGPEFESAYEQLFPVTQMAYLGEGYSIKLEGIEKVNGKPHYVVVITKPSGTKETEYYDTTTNLLMKKVATAEAQGQTITLSTEYSDYEEIDGIKFPSTVSITGAMPEVMVLKKEEIKVNSGLTEADFK